MKPLLLTNGNCPRCIQMANILTSKEIEFDEGDVQDHAANVRALGLRALPIFKLGEKYYQYDQSLLEKIENYNKQINKV